MSSLYRLVYASKNLLQGSDAEIAEAVSQILQASQRNNAKVGVTGALMFNAGAFAQVLEGPQQGVESTFERIQCDARHGDVTVLQCGLAESRGFSNWSMAFVGQSAAGRAQWDGIAAMSGFDLTRLDGDAVFAMLHGLVLDEEGLPVAKTHSPPTALTAPASKQSSGLDVERVRAELPQLGQVLQAARDTATTPALEPATDGSGQRAKEVKPNATLTILRSALAEERRLTTGLRDDLDEVRIALALQQEQSEALRQERDLWARRAEILAAALNREASSLLAGSASEANSPPDRAGGSLRAVS